MRSSLPVFFFFHSFPNILFLLIRWEFHIIFPYHTHFPILPCPPSHPCALPRKQTSKPTKSNLCCPYTHWSMVKLPVASPLKKTEFFPTPIPTRSHQLWRATLQHLHPSFSERSSMVSCLDCFFLCVWGVAGERLAQKPSVCLNCESEVIDAIVKETCLPFIVSSSTEGDLHMVLLTAWAIDIGIISGVNTDHRHPQGHVSMW